MSSGVETSLIISVPTVGCMSFNNGNIYRFLDFARNDRGGLPANVFRIILKTQCLTV